MIFVDPKVIDAVMPDRIKADLDKATTELLSLPESARASFIEDKRNQKIWQDARRELFKVLHPGHSQFVTKCWYCETLVKSRADLALEHFRPKSSHSGFEWDGAYWWLSFSYQNYRIACPACNLAKSNHFPLHKDCRRATRPDDDLEDEVPLLIDPTEGEQVCYLAFDREGRVHPAWENGVARQMADTTIRICRLNQRRNDDLELIEARKQVWMLVDDLIEDADAAWCEWNKTGDPKARKRFEHKNKLLRLRIEDRAEYAAVARTCCRAKGKKWLIDALANGWK